MSHNAFEIHQGVSYNNCLILFIAEEYSIEWTGHSLLVHSVDGHLGSFQFGSSGTASPSQGCFFCLFCFCFLEYS